MNSDWAQQLVGLLLCWFLEDLGREFQHRPSNGDDPVLQMYLCNLQRVQCAALGDMIVGSIIIIVNMVAYYRPLCILVSRELNWPLYLHRYWTRPLQLWRFCRTIRIDVLVPSNSRMCHFVAAIKALQLFSSGWALHRYTGRFYGLKGKRMDAKREWVQQRWGKLMTGDCEEGGGNQHPLHVSSPV